MDPRILGPRWIRGSKALDGSEALGPRWIRGSQTLDGSEDHRPCALLA